MNKKRPLIRRTILVVEDEAINREILGNILNDTYNIEYAVDGMEALNILKQHPVPISLILLDLLMPKMDGFSVLKELKNDDMLRQIPVIVLTSERSAEVESLALGAVDFIPKPYDAPEVIRARVARSIELYEDTSTLQTTESDSLTSLYARDFFFKYCHDYDRYRPDSDMDAIAININHFRLINELYGRSFGNELLVRIAGALADITKELEGIACRSESDMFYMYIPTGMDENDLLYRISSSYDDMPDTSRIHIRMGFYRSVDKDIAVELRFDRAVLACNTLRNNYISFIADYDSDMHEKEIYDERLIADTDMALSEKQFCVYFQPKFNIKGVKPVLSSAEALIRWNHPILGMVSPGDFIPLFEENGLVSRLDRFVWREAAARIREWRDKYGVTIPVSVNVSRMDIYDPNLENELLDIVKTHDISPHDYLLEVTESAYTDNSSQIVNVVNTLRSDGFRVEMDDFGSGYSSLNMLTNLPIDALKLDMVFVQNIKPGNKEYRMVELMMDIARFLEVPVIAEGVENEEQCELLKKAGCDIIQGFYFSRPVPPDEFEKFIRERIEN